MGVLFLFRDELRQLFVLPAILVRMAHHALFEGVAVYDGKRNQLRRAAFPFAQRVRRASLPALIPDIEMTLVGLPMPAKLLVFARA
jgi:hypothetical protein